VSARGCINGDITARRRVELYATATVTGDIVAPNLEMEGGCRFNGQCRMKSPREEGKA
jgi:cytoskeletal protein CcmA (bactofilin family)